MHLRDRGLGLSTNRDLRTGEEGGGGALGKLQFPFVHPVEAKRQHEGALGLPSASLWAQKGRPPGASCATVIVSHPTVPPL